MVINHHKKREIVFMEGDECSGLYIIRTGRVKIVRSSSTGKEQIISIMNPGDLLGFEVFYNGRVYRHTAVAMEDSELVLRREKRLLQDTRKRAWHSEKAHPLSWQGAEQRL